MLMFYQIKIEIIDVYLFILVNFVTGVCWFFSVTVDWETLI